MQAIDGCFQHLFRRFFMLDDDQRSVASAGYLRGIHYGTYRRRIDDDPVETHAQLFQQFPEGGRRNQSKGCFHAFAVRDERQVWYVRRVHGVPQFALVGQQMRQAGLAVGQTDKILPSHNGFSQIAVDQKRPLPAFGHTKTDLQGGECLSLVLSAAGYGDLSQLVSGKEDIGANRVDRFDPCAVHRKGFADDGLRRFCCGRYRWGLRIAILALPALKRYRSEDRKLNSVHDVPLGPNAIIQQEKDHEKDRGDEPAHTNTAV